MKIIILGVAFILLNVFAWAQHTFSIIAIDPATGDIGSAGASCIDNSSPLLNEGIADINGLVIGKGGINAQGFINPTNKVNAVDQIKEGKTAQEVLDWLLTNDVGGGRDTSHRQYGIVTINDTGAVSVAAHSGKNLIPEEAHIKGSNYVIAGNVLGNAAILDTIEAAFLSASGNLADRLMAGLNSVKDLAASTGCYDINVSSLSSFIRLGRKCDSTGLILDLTVSETDTSQSPVPDAITVLNTQFENWKTAGGYNDCFNALPDREFARNAVKIAPNPFENETTISFDERLRVTSFSVYDISGALIWQVSKKRLHTLTFKRGNKPAGIYLYKVRDADGNIFTGKLMITGQ